MKVIETYADLNDEERQLLRNLSIIRQRDYAARANLVDEMRQKSETEKELKFVDSVAAYLKVFH